MSKITIYQKPTCTTCRQVYNMLKEEGVDFNTVNYYIEPLTKEKLKELLRKMKIPAQELLRVKENIYRELNIKNKNFSDDQIVDLMAKHPDLIQRPIVEKGEKAVLARPAERIKEIL
ncbi:MAG: arsenate reductase family protein [Candidatus Omnitrophica bacterium]|nr:arsenate reductase family protein [Candidatus Omnitrophota bacterium]MCB9747088.1 arsenate reductase family protein [Candidatus Omnitrophota bacterium]